MKNFNIVIILLITSIVVFSFGCQEPEDPAPQLNPPPWPSWVHRHWVWENSGTQESAYQLVTDYIDRDIPVGAVIIDRPWQTEPNTFIPDPSLYPDLGNYIQKFHSQGVRVIMWVTSVVNTTASNYQEGLDNGFYVNTEDTISWWGGEGSLIDYTNPSALNWWHSQMNNILDLGIDGWKCDATDPYIITLFPAIGHDGYITWEEYKDMYYRDFFEYTRNRLGNDRVISARPCDDWIGAGLQINFAPVDVNFAGWVGDQDNDWTGLVHALRNMEASSKQNYVSFGSDIGGFRSDGTTYRDVFIRWAQLGAMCPVMENGGSGEHRPWMYDDEIFNIYRKYTYLHHELIPYIYSQAALSYEKGMPTMRIQDGDHTYLLGDHILYAAMFEEGTQREIQFPSGSTWIYLWDEARQYSSGSKTLNFSLEEYPIFIQKGSIIPMDVVNNITGHGIQGSENFTTVLVYPEQDSSGSFGLYEENVVGSTLSYTKSSGSLILKSSPTIRSLLFRVYGDPAPLSVKFANGTAIQSAPNLETLTAMPFGYYRDGAITWVVLKDVSGGSEININY